jgi:hypothetical protein
MTDATLSNDRLEIFVAHKHKDHETALQFKRVFDHFGGGSSLLLHFRSDPLRL